MDVAIMANALYRHAATEAAMKLSDKDKRTLITEGTFTQRGAQGLASCVVEELVRRVGLADRRAW